MTRRFKVWKRDPDGQPGTLLLSTGTPPTAPDFGDHDVFNAADTPEAAALFASLRCGFTGDVLVKDFDAGPNDARGLPCGEWFTFHVDAGTATRSDE